MKKERPTMISKYKSAKNRENFDLTNKHYAKEIDPLKFCSISTLILCTSDFFEFYIIFKF